MAENRSCFALCEPCYHSVAALFLHPCNVHIIIIIILYFSWNGTIHMIILIYLFETSGLFFLSYYSGLFKKIIINAFLKDYMEICTCALGPKCFCDCKINHSWKIKSKMAGIRACFCKDLICLHRPHKKILEHSPSPKYLMLFRKKRVARLLLERGRFNMRGMPCF